MLEDGILTVHDIPGLRAFADESCPGVRFEGERDLRALTNF